MGLLHKGLKVAPAHASTTGYAFGKGVYFADMFDKSYSYSYSNVSDLQMIRSNYGHSSQNKIKV